jgi:hypothetical protein
LAGSFRSIWVFAREWILSTVAVGVTTGLLLYTPFLRPLIGPSLRVRLVLQPYFPLPVVMAVIAGALSRWRYRSSASFWVWVPQSLYVAYRMSSWIDANDSGIRVAISHFFGRCSYPACGDQLESTAYLYITLAYAVGALIFYVWHRFGGTRAPKDAPRTGPEQ